MISFSEYHDFTSLIRLQISFGLSSGPGTRPILNRDVDFRKKLEDSRWVPDSTFEVLVDHRNLDLLIDFK